jgi:hypothetical protein
LLGGGDRTPEPVAQLHITSAHAAAQIIDRMLCIVVVPLVFGGEAGHGLGVVGVQCAAALERADGKLRTFRSLVSAVGVGLQQLAVEIVRAQPEDRREGAGDRDGDRPAQAPQQRRGGDGGRHHQQPEHPPQVVGQEDDHGAGLGVCWMTRDTAAATSAVPTK